MSRAGARPAGRSKLLEPPEAAELRAAVDALLKRAQSWRPPPRGPADGPPATDELLLIVLRPSARPKAPALRA